MAGQPGAGAVEGSGGAGGPVLGRLTGGLQLYVVVGGTIVERIDLDTGHRQARAFQRFDPPPRWNHVALAGDRLVLAGRSIETLAADLSGPTELLDLGFDAGALATEPDGTVWLVRFDFGPGHEVVALDPGGGERHRVRLPPEVAPFGVLGGHVVAVAAGRIYLVDDAGRVTPYATGEIQGLNGDWLAWYGCDDQLGCAFHVGTVEDPAVHRLVVPGGVPASSGAARPTVSPDGTRVVVTVRVSAGVRWRTTQQVIDLAAGGAVVAESPGAFHPVWSPDGQWLLRIHRGGSTGRVDAVDLRTGEVIDLEVLGLHDVDPSVAVAVG